MNGVPKADVIDLREADTKVAKLGLRLRTNRGLSSDSEYPVSANQWIEIIAICEDGEARKKMSGAAALYEALEGMVQAFGCVADRRVLKARAALASVDTNSKSRDAQQGSVAEGDGGAVGSEADETPNA